jgi:hypothetical protein
VGCAPAEGGGARWPLAAMVEALAGIDALAPAEPARARLAELFAGEPDADRVVPHLASMIGLDGITEPDRIRWAIRRLVEVVAATTPLLLRIDDADRAGAGFVRLLADVATAIRDAPVLFAVTSSIEADAIPVIRLGPLSDADVAGLIEDLLGPVEPGVDATIASRLHGSPLAVEQALALLTESGTLAPGQGRWMPLADLARVPFPETTAGSIRQRLQVLPPHELVVLGMAAVAGEIFEVEPLLDAVPGDARLGVPASLEDLVRRGFLTGGPDSFAFRHALLREATLPGVPEWASATTHERSARHLERGAGDRARRFADEIGMHLEAACRERPEASRDDRDDALTHLLAAAEAAVEQGDLEGASRLERSAASLVDDDIRHAELLYLAAEHGALADPDRPADREIAEAALAASGTDEDVDRRVRLLRARLRTVAAQPDALENARSVADEVINAGDESSSWALANAWSLLGVVHRQRAQHASVVNDLTRAADHAAAAGRRGEESDALRGAAAALLDGPLPVDDAEGRCTSYLDRVQGPLAEHDVRSAIALLQARRGGAEDARTAIAASIVALEELGAGSDLAVTLHRAAEIELLAGQLPAADPLMRRALAAAINARDEGLRARFAASFAHILIETEDGLDEATALTDLAETQANDMATQVGWRMARARILARRGHAPLAERLAREGLSVAEQTDSIDLRASALLWAADVRRQAGRPAEAEPFERRAARLLERARSTAKARAATVAPDPGPGDRPPPPVKQTADVDADTNPGAAAVDDEPAAPPPVPEPEGTASRLADEMMAMFAEPAQPEPSAGSSAESPARHDPSPPTERPVAEMAPEDELLDDPTRSAQEESHRRWFNR